MIAYAGATRLARGERDALDFGVSSRDPERRRGRFDESGALR